MEWNAHPAGKTTPQIRGAPAIASLASLFIAAYIIRALGAFPRPSWLDSPAAFTSHLTPLIDHLYTARPTAVNLGAATQRLSASLTASVAAETDAQAVAEAVIKEARAINDEDLGRNKDMSKWGGEWLLETVKKAGGADEKLNVLTVCNTGSLATSVRTISIRLWVPLRVYRSFLGLRHSAWLDYLSARNRQT